MLKDSRKRVLSRIADGFVSLPSESQGGGDVTGRPKPPGQGPSQHVGRRLANCCLLLAAQAGELRLLAQNHPNQVGYLPSMLAVCQGHLQNMVTPFMEHRMQGRAYRLGLYTAVCEQFQDPRGDEDCTLIDDVQGLQVSSNHLLLLLLGQYIGIPGDLRLCNPCSPKRLEQHGLGDEDMAPGSLKKRFRKRSSPCILGDQITRGDNGRVLGVGRQPVAGHHQSEPRQVLVQRGDPLVRTVGG